MPFLWGAATSSHQIEGGNRHNDWWRWEEQGHIENKVMSGQATDHWHRFSEDLQLAEKLGLDSYRFSIEWSRIEPEPGKWDEQALEWYVRLVQECDRRHLIPMATLHHFTLPQWVADQGGLCWREWPERFEQYTKKVASKLGAIVPLWCTVNEPVTLAIGAYVGSFMPPAEFAPQKLGKACRNLFIAHLKAYEVLRSYAGTRQGPWREMPLEVGFAHNMLDFKPSRRWHPVENWMASLFRRLYNRAWLDAVTGAPQHFGVRGLIGYAPPVKEALGKVSTDFIGVNYYTKCYLHWGQTPKEGFSYGNREWLPVGVSFARKHNKISQLGWALHSRGLGRMLRFVKRYKLPIYITENGIADPSDQLRKEYLKSHLAEVASAIRNGIDVRGYYYWSLIDNFEWIKGFDPRFGLVEIDYKNFRRIPRPSADYFRRLIQAHNGNSPDSTLIREVPLDEANGN